MSRVQLALNVTDVDAVMFANTTTGAAVSILTADEASAFCAAVELFIAGRMVAHIADDGALRLVTA
jgi:hypothetical protein